MRTAGRTVLAALVATLATAAGAIPATAEHATHHGADGATYTNPVSSSFADTFADPSLLRGQDNAWYAYGTEDPLHAGESPAKVPMARSTDLVHWTHVGDAFDAPPSYADPETGYWAPDVRYLDGRYVMYYTVTDTKASPDGGDFAIGAATAPTPTGPWTQQDSPVVAPMTDADGNYLTVIDPDELSTPDGAKYLYFGSYTLGVHVTRLSADGLHAVGDPTRVTVNDRYEGSYVVRHDGWNYLMASSANCCAGPATGYAVFAGRSRSPLGPFVDRDGTRLDASRVGGTPVVSPQGNRWIGTGHNAVVTDDSGQQFLVYHAIDRHDPYLAEPFGVNRRPMLIDRLDWIGGWPTVRAGSGASAGAQPAPVTTGPVDDDFTGPLDGSWRPHGGDWRITDGHLGQRADGAAVLTNDTHLPRSSRIRADVRFRGGSHVDLRYGTVTVRLDRRRGTLGVTTGRQRATRALPDDLDYRSWHEVSVEIGTGGVSAQLTEAGLPDPVASVRTGPAAGRGHLSLATDGGAELDNVVVAGLYRPVTRVAAVPRPGARLLSDGFDGGALDPGWSWVRRDDAARVSRGVLSWPTEAHDLADGTNTAGVLLREPPTGDYVAETKVTLDLGTDSVRNFEQAGLVAYAGDGDFARLDQVAIGGTRQVEFGRALGYADGQAWGSSLVGTQARTTWLRLARSTGSDGDQVFRAGSSTDGMHWTWGGAWTFPAGTPVRVGLVSQGGNTPPATARFDYFRLYRTAR
ncbi:MAG: family 43 glycosylhydrolase [Actinocatenispora sp.]